MKQKFKVGDIVIAKKDFFMYQRPDAQFLTKNKVYLKHLTNEEFKIIDDEKRPTFF